MDWIELIMLVVTGGAAGFAGGLLGVGGGLIFTPVLLLYIQSLGFAGEYVTPLAIGTGLLCTFAVAVSSTIGHKKKHVIEFRIAFYCGLASIFAVYLTTAVVTTSSWYTPELYRFIFSVFLVIVALRMIQQSVTGGKVEPVPVDREIPPDRRGLRSFTPVLFGGSLAGLIATAVGVGGGIILVPLYERFLNLPIRRAIGTSSATIVFITFAAVIGYMVNGSGLAITDYSVGYVEFRYALILAVPAVVTARVGVYYSHKTNQRRLRIIFAVLALGVALRLFLSIAGLL